MKNQLLHMALINSMLALDRAGVNAVAGLKDDPSPRQRYSDRSAESQAERKAKAEAKRKRKAERHSRGL